MDKVDRVIMEFFPGKTISGHRRQFLKWAFGEKALTPLLKETSGKQGIEWVESIVDSLKIRCETHNSDYDNIPEHGPAIIFSNHPTVLDGLALVNTVSVVRKDIKIVANHVLSLIFPPTKTISIGIRNMHGKMSHRQLKEMNDHLKKGGVLIICPAGRLASLSLAGLREFPWHAGFIQLACKNNAALIPIHIKGRNTLWYYLTASIWRPLSNLMIIRESLRHRGKRLRVKICQPISLSSLNKDRNDYAQLTADFQQHLERVGNSKPGLLPVQISIARSESKNLLIKTLDHCEILKKFSDGKIAYLYRHQSEEYSPLLREIGRLREICFRATGTGTGKKRDNDVYDNEYYHIVLWDPQDAEIIGAYRIVPAGEQLAKHGKEGLYSASLFPYAPEFLSQVEKSVEIGRGFVQKQHQKTNALDQLWKGIFAFIARYPEYKYLLGVLTIPKSYSLHAQQLIVSFFQLYLSSDEKTDFFSVQYTGSDKDIVGFFSGSDFDQDWRILNKKLNEMGYELPWPYKQAAKWYMPGGSRVLGFVNDDHFNSVAGLNICEIAKLKTMYARHYNKASCQVF